MKRSKKLDVDVLSDILINPPSDQHCHQTELQQTIAKLVNAANTFVVTQIHPAKPPSLAVISRTTSVQEPVPDRKEQAHPPPLAVISRTTSVQEPVPDRKEQAHDRIAKPTKARDPGGGDTVADGEKKACNEESQIGWEKFPGEIYIPYSFRQSERYCAVRIVHSKLFKKYLNVLHQDIYSCAYVRSYYMTEAESKLFNELNTKNNFQFGREMFTLKDRVMLLSDVYKFYQFLVVCYKKLPNDKCGFIRINKESVVPYTVRDNQKMMPLFYFGGETDKLKADYLSGWDLSYLKFCCKVEGIRNELFASDSVAVISLTDIKGYFPPGTEYEEYWPRKIVEPQFFTSGSKSNNTVQVPPSAAISGSTPAPARNEDQIAKKAKAVKATVTQVPPLAVLSPQLGQKDQVQRNGTTNPVVQQIHSTVAVVSPAAANNGSTPVRGLAPGGNDELQRQLARLAKAGGSIHPVVKQTHPAGMQVPPPAVIDGAAPARIEEHSDSTPVTSRTRSKSPSEDPRSPGRREADRVDAMNGTQVLEQKFGPAEMKDPKLNPRTPFRQLQNFASAPNQKLQAEFNSMYKHCDELTRIFNLGAICSSTPKKVPENPNQSHRRSKSRNDRSHEGYDLPRDDYDRKESPEKSRRKSRNNRRSKVRDLLMERTDASIDLNLSLPYTTRDDYDETENGMKHAERSVSKEGGHSSSSRRRKEMNVSVQQQQQSFENWRFPDDHEHSPSYLKRRRKLNTSTRSVEESFEARDDRSRSPLTLSVQQQQQQQQQLFENRRFPGDPVHSPSYLKRRRKPNTSTRSFEDRGDRSRSISASSLSGRRKKLNVTTLSVQQQQQLFENRRYPDDQSPCRKPNTSMRYVRGDSFEVRGDRSRSTSTSVPRRPKENTSRSDVASIEDQDDSSSSSDVALIEDQDDSSSSSDEASIEDQDQDVVFENQHSSSPRRFKVLNAGTPSVEQVERPQESRSAREFINTGKDQSVSVGGPSRQRSGKGTSRKSLYKIACNAGTRDYKGQRLKMDEHVVEIEGDNAATFIADLWGKVKGLLEREVFITQTKNDAGVVQLTPRWSENAPVFDDISRFVEFCHDDGKRKNTIKPIHILQKPVLLEKLRDAVPLPELICYKYSSNVNSLRAFKAVEGQLLVIPGSRDRAGAPSNQRLREIAEKLEKIHGKRLDGQHIHYDLWAMHVDTDAPKNPKDFEKYLQRPPPLRLGHFFPMKTEKKKEKQILQEYKLADTVNERYGNLIEQDEVPFREAISAHQTLGQCFQQMRLRRYLFRETYKTRQQILRESIADIRQTKTESKEAKEMAKRVVNKDDSDHEDVYAAEREEEKRKTGKGKRK